MPRPTKAFRRQKINAAIAYKRGDKTEAYKLWEQAATSTKEHGYQKRNKKKIAAEAAATEAAAAAAAAKEAAAKEKEAADAAAKAAAEKEAAE
jgi:colicin import membrane protein